jgi:Cu2+-exporting ATPase
MTPSVRAAFTPCAHCSLPVPPGLIDPTADQHFCCSGCKTAYDLINSCGLSNYYAFMHRLNDRPAKADSSILTSTREEFDHPAFMAQSTTDAGDGLRQIELTVLNMHCSACVWLLEKLPAFIKGVRTAQVRLHGSALTITFDPQIVKLSTLLRTLASLGYPAHPAREVSAAAARRINDRAHLIRIAIAGALAANIMMFSFVLYGGLFVGIEPVYEQFFRWLSAVLGIVCLVGPGMVFFRSAFASLRARSLNLDVPICTALLVGGIMGTVNTVLGSGEMYFDSLAMLVFFLLVGRFLQHRQQRWATDEVELLYSLTPSTANLIDAPGAPVSTKVPTIALQPGQFVRVLPGESIPSDGLIVRGETAIDSSILTGESRPVKAELGASVFAGAVNVSSPIDLRVTAAGRATRAARLMQLVAQGAQRRARIIRFTDRVASWFVVGTALAAIVTFLAWMGIDKRTALEHASAMLIVTCPCALGLAAPLVMSIAMGRGARAGVMVKGPDVLEDLSTPAVLVLDKTGTVTEGRMRVTRFEGALSAAALAAQLERQSTHPVARAIVDFAGHLADTPASPSSARHVIGSGITGLVDGLFVAVGSPAFIHSLGIDTTTDPRLDHEITSALDQALTPVLVAVEDSVLGVFSLGDRLRPEAPAAINTLQRQGWDIRLLSGDDPAVVRQTAQRLGIDPRHALGRVSPEEKFDYIRTIAAQNKRVVMMGDGVNDAAALAAATVGIAVHRGAEACISAADVYFAREGLDPLLALTDASRRAMTAVRVTLYASLTYNIIAGSLTFIGLIHPLIAAILMPLSSLTMLLIAMRARTFAPVTNQPDTLIDELASDSANTPIAAAPRPELPSDRAITSFTTVTTTGAQA